MDLKTAFQIAKKCKLRAPSGFYGINSMELAKIGGSKFAAGKEE